jgi:hypothetical protein
MDFETAVKNVVIRFNELGYGCTFKLHEIEKWLELKPGEDFYFVIDSLNEQLVIEHKIFLSADSKIHGFQAIPPSETIKRLAMIGSRQGHRA